MLSDMCLRHSTSPKEVPVGRGHFFHMSTTLGGMTKLFRKELGLDIQMMDFAVVMHTEVNGMVSGLLKQGDEILP